MNRKGWKMLYMNCKGLETKIYKQKRIYNRLETSMICTEKDGREILYEQQRLGNKYYMNRKGWKMLYMNCKGLETKIYKQKRIYNRLETSMICTEKDGREILYEQQRLGNKYYMNRKGWEMFYMNSKGLEKSVIWTEKDGRCFIWIAKAWRQKYINRKGFTIG